MQNTIFVDPSTHLGKRGRGVKKKQTYVVGVCLQNDDHDAHVVRSAVFEGVDKELLGHRVGISFTGDEVDSLLVCANIP